MYPHKKKNQEDGQVHPVANTSSTLNPHEKHYGITEMETLTVVVWAAKHYLDITAHYSLITQHVCLCWTPPHPSAKLATWAMCIQELDLEIKHKPGKHNTNVDTLVPKPQLKNQFKKANRSNIGCSHWTIEWSCRCDNTKHLELNHSVMELHQQQMQWVCELQLRDADLEAMIAYLKKEQLPKEEKAAKKLILESRSLRWLKECESPWTSYRPCKVVHGSTKGRTPDTSARTPWRQICWTLS